MPESPTRTAASVTSAPAASRLGFSAPGKRRTNGAASGLPNIESSEAATPRPAAVGIGPTASL
eukprot:11206474-Lingulodinium_polyedra.AAC.1